MKSVDLVELILRLRRSRMGLIQTSQQLQFCWRSVATALLGGDKGNCSCDAQPSEWPKIVPQQLSPLGTGGAAESLSDLSDTTARKRSVGRADEGTEDVKRSKRLFFDIFFLFSF